MNLCVLIMICIKTKSGFNQTLSKRHQHHNQFILDLLHAPLGCICTVSTLAAMIKAVLCYSKKKKKNIPQGALSETLKVKSQLHLSSHPPISIPPHGRAHAFTGHCTLTADRSTAGAAGAGAGSGAGAGAGAGAGSAFLAGALTSFLGAISADSRNYFDPEAQTIPALGDNTRSVEQSGGDSEQEVTVWAYIYEAIFPLDPRQRCPRVRIG